MSLSNRATGFPVMLEGRWADMTDQLGCGRMQGLNRGGNVVTRRLFRVAIGLVCVAQTLPFDVSYHKIHNYSQFDTRLY